ncbi:hypothetical protein GIB67_015020 [Kingdonia uniflora]|uniref:Pentatricopeptide repeat-containing protein n=1 Tax=Kingdonia uniflora TaxID=39325 RepID=A0A7J7MTL4_9MAGN|nr:hypothetical protein GIB67_015020 [Kingdonia uniflora]
MTTNTAYNPSFLTTTSSIPILTSFSIITTNPISKKTLKISSLLSPPKPQNNATEINALTIALEKCANTFSIREGTQIHARIIRLGFSHNVYISRKILFFYSRVNDVDAARLIFDGVSITNLNHFFYNTMIRGYVDSNMYSDAIELFYQMLVLGFSPNEFTYPFVLKCCSILGMIELARMIHGLMVVNGYQFDVFAASSLLDVYAKCGRFRDSCKLFDRIPERSEVTWNSMVSGYAQNGYWEEALRVLDFMEDSGFEVKVSCWNSIMAGCVRCGDTDLAFETFRRMSVRPNSATFNTLLPVIPTGTSLNQLKEIHGYSVKQKGLIGLDSVDDDRLRSSHASGYAFHGCMLYASRLFDGIHLKTSQLWISMISGFIDSKQSHEAFRVFRDMVTQCGCEMETLSQVPITLLLLECSPSSLTGLEIHARACRVGFESSTSVNNALIAMYAKRGNIELSERVFYNKVVKDIVSWNTMISSYINNNDFGWAFELFHRMHSEDIKPDEFTVSSILSGCVEVGGLQKGMAIHGYMIRSGLLEGDLVVQNSLMDMYGKCGCIEEAQKVFGEMIRRDIVSWNTLIFCYGLNSLLHEAFSLYDEMQERGQKPNSVTFIALLSACSHSGMVDKCLQFFKTMTTECGIIPDVEHYACIVDTLGRKGRIDEAYQLIKSMPMKPNDSVWGALLGSCRIHGIVTLAEVAARHLRELKPQHPGYHVLLSNIFKNAHRWKDAKQVRTTMKDMGVNKLPGCSWIEINGKCHKFFTAEKSHAQGPTIHFTLDGNTRHLISEDYVPS